MYINMVENDMVDMQRNLWKKGKSEMLHHFFYTLTPRVHCTVVATVAVLNGGQLLKWPPGQNIRTGGEGGRGATTSFLSSWSDRKKKKEAGLPDVLTVG